MHAKKGTGRIRACHMRKRTHACVSLSDACKERQEENRERKRRRKWPPAERARIVRGLALAICG